MAGDRKSGISWALLGVPGIFAAVSSLGLLTNFSDATELGLVLVAAQRVSLGALAIAGVLEGVRLMRGQPGGRSLNAENVGSLENAGTQGNVAGQAESQFQVTQGNLNVYMSPQPSGTVPEESAVPNNLPFTDVTAFAGREEDLQALHGLLQARGQVAVCVGMGGVGKTELAKQYARRHLADYPGGLCWCFARVGDVGQAIASFGRARFAAIEALPKDLPVRELVRRCYEVWPSGQVLLVLDDVVDREAYEAVQAVLPTDARFKVLLTSRATLLDGSRRLELEVLEIGAAVALLTALSGREFAGAAATVAVELCEWLGRLPLGVELAGKYLEACPGLTVGEYLQRLRAKGLESRSLQDLTPAFDLSWELLSAEAQALAVQLALFAAAPIPWELAARALGEDANPEDVEQWRDRELVRGHLLERVEADVVRLHPLVREFLRQKGEKIEGLAALQQAVAKAIVVEADRIEERMSRQALAAVAPVVPHITELAEKGLEWLAEEDFVWPFVRLSRYYKGLVDFSLAQQWCARCLTVVEARLGKDHYHYATGLSNLATFYDSTGKFKEAALIGKKVLEWDRNNLPRDHPDISISLNNQANYLSSLKRFEEALPLMEEALARDRQYLSDSSPKIAIALGNLAKMYGSLERHVEALSLMKEALARDRKYLPRSSPTIAIRLNNLSILHCKQGDFDAALSCAKEALEHSRQYLMKSDPESVFEKGVV